MKSPGHKPLTQLLSIAESYDLKIEKDVQIANRGVLPGVEEYTMCYWLRLVKDWINLAQTQSGASDTGARVISAYKRNVNGELVYITYTLRPSQDPSAPIYMRIDWSTEKKMYVCMIQPSQIMIILIL